MTYNADLTWDDLSRIAGTAARAQITTAQEAKKQYDEWQSFRAGRTNAAIATALARTEAEIANMDSCFAVGSDLENFYSNVAVGQSDRYYSLRQFS